ncbi:membrane fusion protein (multidrug efflux system) [Litorivivens lipolytica]|uniref:Membrane fusion protein (Multidrug efflux system) n=1 Tax=Litorivivens lipolytica TaxID=1524264 RepID=A0A7W4Z531_9GAMM|nr:efflux RND transporter periplasmic adaptor subunit [Litorivivens lipolytica]MBB3046788.1 membrane fusion protein (multidrug efflux system) [Litorivivens lipolytica]
MRFATRLLFPFLLVALTACEQPSPPSQKAVADKELVVSTATLQPRDWQLAFTAYGHFETTEEIAIAVDFSGTVEKVYFRDGQNVAAGDLLIELDDQKQQLRVRQSKANLVSARAELEKSRETHFRYRDLMGKGALSREQLNDSQASYERSRAKVEEAEAALALAEKDLRETRIISPVDGVVAEKRVEPGQTVLAGNSLALLHVADTLRVVTFVSEREVNQLRLGDEATVTTPAVPGRTFDARVELVGSEADANTGNFTVKLTVNNRDRLLRPGMSALVELRGIVRSDMLVLDKGFLVDRNRRRVVFIVEDGKAREVEPSFAASAGDELPVLAGLKPGDQLITSQLDLLADGKAVTLASEQP